MATARHTTPIEIPSASVSETGAAPAVSPGTVARRKDPRPIGERFEALLRQVQANRPNEDISLIRKAWEFCVSHHEGQMRASRRALYFAPARGGRGAGGDEAGRDGHRRCPAARCRGGYAGDQRGDWRAIRRPGGAHCRGRDQDRQDPVCQPRGPAGRERAQDAAGHGERRARGADQAGRPAAQHAHAGAPASRIGRRRLRARRWIFTRRWRTGWAWARCAASWKTWPSAIPIP